jgi:hypothetical protein
MKWEDYQLDSEVSKVSEDMVLWKNDKGIIEISGGSLAIRVIVDSHPCGYVFHGKGKLLIDTIVETNKGAVGKSVERVLDEPFLMLGSLDDQKLEDVKSEDFSLLGYENKEQVSSKAEQLLAKFFEKSNHKHSRFLEGDRGFIFAFLNDKGKLDILVSKDDKIVYTSTDKVFVSKGEKIVLTSRGKVIALKSGKSIIVEENCGPIIHIHKGDREWFF